MARIAMTGSTGMVGTALRAAFEAAGHEVIGLARQSEPGVIVWNSATDELDPAVVSGSAAVINLAGENLADGRWTEARKEALRSSRLLTTSKLAHAIAKAVVPPTVLVSVSATGFYGNRGDEVLTEESPAGDDFLAQLCIDWEAAALPAQDAGVRVVHPRFGVIVSRHGGALDKMLPFFKAGVGGRYGNGEQWMPWIALTDVVRGVEFVIAQSGIMGPVNFVSPTPVRNKEFADALGAALHRPAIVPAPAFALHLALGEMADGAILNSQRVLPAVLEDAGFAWERGALQQALEAVTTSSRTVP